MPERSIEECKEALTRLIQNLEAFEASESWEAIRSLTIPDEIFPLDGEYVISSFNALSKESKKKWRNDEEYKVSLSDASEYFLKPWGWRFKAFEGEKTFQKDLDWLKAERDIFLLWNWHLVLETGYRGSISKFARKLYVKKIAFRVDPQNRLKQMGVEKKPLALRIFLRLLWVALLGFLIQGAAIIPQLVKR